MSAIRRIPTIVVLVSVIRIHAADFDLRDASVENLDGGQSLQLTVDGITATVRTVIGVLNQEAGGFGATTGADDDGDFLINGQDVITIEFDQEIVWDGFTVSGQEEFECGSISLDDINQMIFCGSGAMTQGQGMTVDPVSGIVTIRPSDTGGFSLDSFSVTAGGGPGDSDGDGVPDEDDVAPDDEFQCRDEDGDGCDDCSVTGQPNVEQDGADADGDGICDAGDSDRDGDSVPNGDDADADDPFLCGDSDGDECDDCRFSGGPPDPENDGADLNDNGLCDASEGLPDVIFFDMLDPSFANLDDETEFSLKRGPLVANIRSPLHFLFQGDGTFGTGPGFFDPPDDALIDGDESVEIQFNYDVRWQWVELSQLGGGDCARLTIDGAAFEPCGSGSKTDGADTLIMRVAPPFPKVVIGAVGGAQFSLDRFAAVPLVAESIIDLQLTAAFPKRVVPSEDPISIGEELILRFELENIGPSDADEVIVQTTIPAELSILEATAPAGTTYDAGSGVWSVPHIDTEFRPGGQDLSPLIIRVQINPGSGESIRYTAEVAGSLQVDEDSTAGNGIIDEDDDDEQTIDIARPGQGEAQINPLLAALLTIFTCGSVGTFAPIGTFFGLMVFKRRMRTARRRTRARS